MINTIRNGIVILCLIELITTLSFAEELNRKKQEEANRLITINADRLEADGSKSMITFTGKVIAKQGEMIIYSDILHLVYSKKRGEIERVIAQGNVKITQDNEKRVATAGEATFLNQERKVILTKNPQVWQDKDVVSGEIITLFIEEDRSIVQGGEKKRVSATIHTKNK